MTRDPIHPGKFLADELDALDMTPTQLATTLKVPPMQLWRQEGGHKIRRTDMVHSFSSSLIL